MKIRQAMTDFHGRLRRTTAADVDRFISWGRLHRVLGGLFIHGKNIAGEK
jgi:hypothetical protein